MSNATEHSHSSGKSSRRRRSRGGRNRNSQHKHQDPNRRSSSSQRAEEFRPQGPRPPRHAPLPPKLSFWQKILKAVGLYKEPVAPARAPQQKPQSQPQEAKSQQQSAPKSNTRNARSEGNTRGEGKPAAERQPSSGKPRERAPRGDKPRGGDGSSVESPRVYVGNLSYDVTEQDLQELFKGIGPVRNVEIVYNRSTHRSKGYGFVEMLHKDEAVRSVEVLHDQPFMGRKLIVSGAKSKGQDEREDKEEERPQERVKLAPLPPVEAVQAAAPATEAAEPTIQTIVETVAETPAAEAENKSEVA